MRHRAKERRELSSEARQIFEHFCLFCRLGFEATVVGVFLFMVIFIGEVTVQGVKYAATVEMPWAREEH